jgi:hypothetical protein
MPTFTEDFEGSDFSENEEEVKDTEEFLADEPIENGDRNFMINMPNESTFIQATATTSQHLAEAFFKSSPLNS